MGPGTIQEATPLVHDGVMYLPSPSDMTQALDARTGELLWEYRRKLPEDLGKFLPAFDINRNLAIYGNTIIDTSADDYVYALNAETGALAWETKILDYQKRRAADVRADHRQRQDHLRPRLRAGRRPRGVRRHRARREDRQGTVAHADDSRAGRAGRRDVGRRPDREAAARRHLDGAELRPGAEPGLHRHVGHRAGAEVPARRQRQGATCTTTRRWRSTPTPARSSGTTSTSSTTGTSTIRSSGCSSTPP